MKIQSVNPATGEVSKEFESYSRDRIKQIAKSTNGAFPSWRELSMKDRAGLMLKLAKALRSRKEEYARLITLEMGKPIRQSLEEVEKCAWTAEVYADNSEKWLAEESVVADGKTHLVSFEPLGMILSIMPWNFPFWQALRFAIPALAAGNVSVLRHSNVVPQCALALEDAFKNAGFPENVFRTILTDHDAVNYLIRSGMISGVSVTGSVEVGSKVGRLAGKYVKKFVLELGGSDPFIVLEDSDVDFAAENAVRSRMIDSGQSCIAAKRFIVVKEIADRFTKRFVELVKELKVGNPQSFETEIGPMANVQQVETLEAQVKDAVEKGAEVAIGGRRISGRGAFFEPTVLINIKRNMRVLNEEVFGPVAPIVVVKNESDAIRVANSSELGLGASVWSSDGGRALRIARKLEAGSVFINGVVKSDPRMPFGGIKKSGIGRELSSYGLREFVNVKGINVYEQHTASKTMVE